MPPTPLKRLSKRLYFSGISALPVRLLQNRSPLPLLSPYHHLVSDEPVPYIEPLYDYKDTRRFETDLGLLLPHSQPLPLEEVLRQQATAPAPPAISSSRAAHSPPGASSSFINAPQFPAGVAPKGRR